MIKAGEKLQQARLEKGLSLEDVAKATKIKQSFLSDIESGNYQDLPSSSYAQGFVRNYAKFLGLPEEEILALFRREFDEEKAYRVLPKGLEGKEGFPIARIKIGQAVFIAALVFIAFLGYMLFQYRYAFINPSLDIISPRNLSTVTSTEISVIGKTDSDSTVYVNKDEVSVDQNGNFQKIINAFPGKETITVRAVNKFSRETEKQIQINVKTGT
jgi:cytoskeletal protein RodZ